MGCKGGSGGGALGFLWRGCWRRNARTVAGAVERRQICCGVGGVVLKVSRKGAAVVVAATTDVPQLCQGGGASGRSAGERSLCSACVVAGPLTGLLTCWLALQARGGRGLGGGAAALALLGHWGRAAYSLACAAHLRPRVKVRGG